MNIQVEWLINDQDVYEFYKKLLKNSRSSELEIVKTVYNMIYKEN